MNTSLKIKKYRELKNYTQEYMAEKLDISQNTYSKIENGGIKLTVDRLKQISDILETPVEEMINGENQVFNFHNSNIEKFYGYIESLHEDNKELTMTTIKILNDQLSYLQKENERLLTLLEKNK